jgi:PAS domain S-box-containing protein
MPSSPFLKRSKIGRLPLLALLLVPIVLQALGTAGLIGYLYYFRSHFTAEFQSHLTLIVLLCLLIFLVAIALGLLATHLIMTPILRLRKASKLLNPSERWQPLPEDTAIAELNTLAKSFNRIAQSLQISFQTSEEKFAKIFMTSPDPITIVKLSDGTCLDVNDKFLALTGFTYEEVIGQTLNDLNFMVHPEQSLEIYHLLQTQQATHNYEMDLRLKSGKIVTGLLSTELIELEGEVFGISVFKDISDRKLAETALRESEENYRFIVETSEEGIWKIDADNLTMFVNSSMASMLGYSIEEMLGKSLFDFMDQEGREIALTYLESRRQGVREVHDFKFCRKDGADLWGLVSANPIMDGSGQYLGALAMITDITDRQKIEKIKNEFISVVSHELRTPLTAIRGSIGILASGVYDQKPEKAQHMLQIALNNSDRLARLVNDILDLERLESGKAQMVMSACNVAELMRQAVESVQEMAAQTYITIHLTPLSTEIWAAPDAIVQTITNLLSNAIKFSQAGSIVWLSAENGLSEDTTPYILFSVKDRGRGLPADQLEKIFERFCQVDVSDSRQKGGTGLGLAICLSIVEQHGGKIWAESTMGKGSSFYFTLPLAVDF